MRFIIGSGTGRTYDSHWRNNRHGAEKRWNMPTISKCLKISLFTLHDRQTSWEQRSTPCQPRCLDLQMPRANQVFGWHPSQPRRESLYPASRCCSWCRMWRGSCIWSSDSRCSLKCSFIFLHCWCQNDSNANSKARWLDANQILFEQFTRGIARLLSACLIEKNDNSMVEDWWSCQRRNTICCWRGGHLFVTAVLHSCVLSVLLVTDRCASGYPTVLWTTVGNSNMAIHSFVSGIHRPELFTYSSHFFHHLWIDRYCLWPLGECFQPNRSGVELSTSQLAGKRSTPWKIALRAYCSHTLVMFCRSFPARDVVLSWKHLAACICKQQPVYFSRVGASDLQEQGRHCKGCMGGEGLQDGTSCWSFRASIQPKSMSWSHFCKSHGDAQSARMQSRKTWSYLPQVNPRAWKVFLLLRLW